MHPITGVQSLCEGLDITPATARKIIQHLISLGIVKEITKKQRDHLFTYEAYLKILNANTAPLSGDSL